jgi:hypothetical protein
MGTVMTHKDQSTAALNVGAARGADTRGADTRGADGEAEQTGVRVTRATAPVPAPGLELKLARARSVIAHMAPADPRARLLHVAMLRRDEILLEALLRRLDSVPPF